MPRFRNVKDSDLYLRGTNNYIHHFLPHETKVLDDNVLYRYCEGGGRRPDDTLLTVDEEPSDGNPNVTVDYSLLYPEILCLDSDLKRVYLQVSLDVQIEVYRYTRHKRGPHITNDDIIFSPRIGKRFKPLLLLPKGMKYWDVPSRWIGKTKRGYFKFGFWFPSGIRSRMSTQTLVSPSQQDLNNTRTGLSLLG